MVTRKTKFVSFVDARSRRAYLLSMLFLLLPPAGCAAEDLAPADTGAAVKHEWSAASVNGLFNITLGPRSGTVTIGKFQVWHLRLTNADGELVFPARFAIGGGMQGHGHGLPTQPRVTGFLDDGRYVIEGMKFNMAGDWTLYLTIEAELGPDHEQRSDQVMVDVNVDY